MSGGFCLDHFEEEVDDAEARRILGEYASVAMVYVLGAGVIRRSKVLTRVLVIPFESGHVTLRRSLLEGMKGVLSSSR